jgi:hypothetical protein
LVYKYDAPLLPNLYPLPLQRDITPNIWDGYETLRIGAFGAVRPLKNFTTAAATALAIHEKLDVPTELHMSSGGESSTLEAIDQICGNVPGFDLIRHPWSYWDSFIRLIADMHLLIQPSYTESFNLITADGISVGVPSVVSSAINWAPKEWKADMDNPLEIADVGIRLLRGRARWSGYKALKDHNICSLPYWFKFLGIQKNRWWEF